MTEVYDLECMPNLFTYTGYDYKHDRWNVFVISQWRNDCKKLIEHLGNLKIMIGYNNENYDYPLLHHFIKYYVSYVNNTGIQIANELYSKSQSIIENDYNSIPDKDKFIKQIDLYLIMGYNNNARHCSLKDVEFALRMDNVEEMPVDYSKYCNEEDVQTVLDYNRNDVWATYLLYKIVRGNTDNILYKGKDKLKLRISLKKKYGLPCINYPDIKIGERLILDLYCKKTGKKKYDIRKAGGTKRNQICLKDCIPEWAVFKSKEFNDLKNKFQETCISSIKGEFSASVVYHNIKIDYGTGGAHASCKPGVYVSDNDWIIMDCDVSSLYPSIAIQLGIYPEHLGKEFIDIYDKEIVSKRLNEKKKPKKERNAVIIEGFKLAANSIYGKSGEEKSFLYDPLYTMKTTVGGQMFISLWIEKLVHIVSEIKFLQVNTDGISFLIPKSAIEKVNNINKGLTLLTGLNIETNIYSKFIIRDVNNYIAQYENGECKMKGCFEVDKELHKDSSMRIVPMALKEYFINGIPIKDTIMNHRDIYDFCLKMKVNSKSEGYYKYLVNGEIESIKLNRTTRYYISKTGGRLFKRFEDGKIVDVNSGYNTTLFNKYEDKDNYNLNYNFYIAEANKIKNSVENIQLSLFN